MFLSWLPLLLFVCGAPPAQAARLVNFQVAQPPVVPANAKACTIQVLQRDFAFSFGSAEVVELSPPTDCGAPGSWAAVTLNLTVTSNGTQFDRLGTFTFQNVEIWRTSTPEPTKGDGIIWTYVKDVTYYMPLFAKPGSFIFQLDNLIRPDLDGIYSTVVHATYYASSAPGYVAKQADLIIPLATLANNTGGQASVPPGFTSTVTFPQNTVAVYAELQASGNGQEEFWYNNVPNQYLPSLPPNTALGQGPFREVRLLIDRRLAGVVLPYPVIFTGGIAPSLWRPISAYGAIELPTYFLDVTPFVPLLVDGKAHEITLDVVSAEPDHVILQNWYISGSLQVVTDPSGNPTKGRMTNYEATEFAESQSYITGPTQTGDVNVTLTASRKLRIESDIITGSGRRIHAVWSQALSYENRQSYLDNTTVQLVRQISTGVARGYQNDIPSVTDDYSYPLNIDVTFLDPKFTSWNTHVDHSYIRTSLPSRLRRQTMITGNQIADAFFKLKTGGNFGNGTSENTFDYIDFDGNTYSRQVSAANNVIIHDHESGSLAGNVQGVTPQGVLGTPGAFELFPSPRLPGRRTDLKFVLNAGI